MSEGEPLGCFTQLGLTRGCGYLRMMGAHSAADTLVVNQLTNQLVAPCQVGL